MEAVVTAETPSVAGWWVQVRGKAYGPYSLDQLSAFVKEGRIRSTTQVSNEPERGWTAARRIETLAATFNATEKFANSNMAVDGANVFIYAEINSGGTMAFIAALEAMGPICMLANGAWILRTRLSAGIIRNTLSQTLDRGDKFAVIDATRDRFAWFNLGPEVDVTIKGVWNAALRPEVTV